ncbi:hypothetical protein SmJEL517_g05979 [Synchytrium microbalum]|uniref:NAD(P)-binding protein n=1 Tax=Synchytrium microbalum TaxID=1806994 RepID=A0A507BTT3_9FUNG|nr:uncharacterized protein SmJEL517_g05979 [Synchytrium microbalum]TPX30469.1 hypothetical protein SmJEL517_g05979 [Synchytrium microbalum]
MSTKKEVEQHRREIEGVSMVGKSAVIIGGTQGIGLGVALSLARLGASVTIVGRNAELGQQAVTRLTALSPSNAKAKFAFAKVDATSMKELKEFAAQYAEANKDGLDYFVHTAGVMAFPGGKVVETAEGVEYNFALMYLSRFAATNLLLPLLKLKEGSRVLYTFLPAFKGQKMDYDDIESKKSGRLSMSSCLPLTVDLLTEALAQRAPQVSFIHMQPGWVITDLLNNSKIKGVTSYIINGLTWLLLPPGKTIEEFGDTAIVVLTRSEFSAANSPLLLSAKLEKLKMIKWAAEHPEAKDKLWEYSAKISGIGGTGL